MNEMDEIRAHLLRNRPDADIPFEGQIARLIDFLAKYQRPCPFKVGDLVHPRAESPIKDHGKPHMVVAIPETPLRSSETNHFSSAYGESCDMRVAEMNGDHIVLWCVESFWFEIWTEGGE
jgi:hypothetical protein